MTVIRDEAIVLGRLDYSETSQVIVLFTREHGKVRAIAKGIKRGTKKRFAVGIDLLDVGHVVASTRQDRTANLATVTEWTQTKSLSGLRDKLFRILAAQYAAEVTVRLTEDWDPHTKLFDALLASLTELCEAIEPLGPLVVYQFHLLDSIGSLPRFDACASCNRDTELTHFSSFEGGVICRRCAPAQIEKREVTAPTLKMLKGASSGAGRVEIPPSPAVGANDLRPGFSGPFALLNYHISHLSGRDSTMAAKLIANARV